MRVPSRIFNHYSFFDTVVILHAISFVFFSNSSIFLVGRVLCQRVGSPRRFRPPPTLFHCQCAERNAQGNVTTHRGRQMGPKHAKIEQIQINKYIRYCSVVDAKTHTHSHARSITEREEEHFGRVLRNSQKYNFQKQNRFFENVLPTSTRPVSASQPLTAPPDSGCLSSTRRRSSTATFARQSFAAAARAVRRSDCAGGHKNRNRRILLKENFLP